MKLHAIVAAVALVAAGAANATLTNMSTGNSTLAFVALDNATTNTAAKGSLFVDLGFDLTDFLPTASLAGANQTVVWNLKSDTVTVNGVAKAGVTNDWASQFNAYAAAAGADTQWGVIAGNSISPFQFLTSGTPTASQLTQQTSSQTSAMVGVDSLYQASNGQGSLSTVAGANGAYFANSSGDAAYVGSNNNFGTNWKANLKWASLTKNAQTNLTLVNNNGTEQNVGAYTPLATDTVDTTGLLNATGTFTYDQAAGTLTWKTAKVTPGVPEPESFALMIAGLAAVGFVARRRAAK